MARLTNNLKSAIVNNLVENKNFKERQIKLMREIADISFEIYTHIVKEKGLTLGKVMHQVNKVNEINNALSGFSRFVPNNGNGFFIAVMGGERRTIYLNGRTDTRLISYPEEGFVTYFDGYILPVGQPNVTDIKLREKLDNVKSRYLDLDEEIKDFTVTVETAVSKFTTVKKLVEAWPEVESMIPKDIIAPVTKGTQVAISREDLNAICGLPK